MPRDIEEFLRKAAERRAKQKAGQQPPPSTPPARRPDPEPLIVEGVEIVEPEPVKPRIKSRLEKRKIGKPDMRRESVADHVKRHMDTSHLGEQSSNLGERIASVHDQIDDQVHAHLDHDISKVDDKPTITDDPPPAIFGKRTAKGAKLLREMLSNPQEVGNAILLAEILKRPDFD